MNPCRFVVLPLGLLIASLCVSGCGQTSDRPELGGVSGTVTMDGKPLAGTVVVFLPDNGRPSRGRTNAEGKYELTYIGETLGAKVGHHRVEIAPNEEDEDQSEIDDATAGESTDGPKSTPKPGKIRVPTRYNVNSELSADVVAGTNVFDFSLESKGQK